MICAMAIAIAIVAGSCAYAHQEIETATEAAARQVKAAAAYCEDGNTDGALSAIRNAGDIWKEHEFRLQLLLSHAVIHEAGDMLARCECHIRFGDTDDFLAQAQALLLVLEDCRLAGHLTWGNLL